MLLIINFCFINKTILVQWCEKLISISQLRVRFRIGAICMRPTHHHHVPCTYHWVQPSPLCHNMSINVTLQFVSVQINYIKYFHIYKCNPKLKFHFPVLRLITGLVEGTWKSSKVRWGVPFSTLGGFLP